MKRNLFFAAFALVTIMSASCSAESRIDRQLNRLEKLIDNRDAFAREKRIARIGEKLDAYEESDFTESQSEKLLELVIEWQEEKGW